MPLSRSVRSNKRWPEWWSVIVPRVDGQGFILQLNFVFAGQRFEATMPLAADRSVTRADAGKMLREMAWLVDGVGDDPTQDSPRAAESQRHGLRGFVARVVGL